MNETMRKIPGNSILDNELVKKYFGCGCFNPNRTCPAIGNCKDEMAGNVLRAMQEPIKNGDRVLFMNTSGDVKEDTAASVCLPLTFHGTCLRLPSRFQGTEKKECGCSCHHQANKVYESQCKCHQPAPSQTCNDPKAHGCGLPPKPSEAVEEKIKQIIDEYIESNAMSWPYLKEKLRELVAMVRKGK